MLPQVTEMRPELFFGVVAAVGTDTRAVCGVLSAALTAIGYKPQTISLTDELRKLPRYSRLADTPVDLYYSNFMRAGDDFCDVTGRDDAMAALGVAAVSNLREELNEGDPETPIDGVAYIFRSLKRRGEVELLRQTYGDHFALIAAYSPRDVRVDALAARIAESHGARKADIVLQRRH